MTLYSIGMLIDTLDEKIGIGRILNKRDCLPTEPIDYWGNHTKKQPKPCIDGYLTTTYTCSFPKIKEIFEYEEDYLLYCLKQKLIKIYKQENDSLWNERKKIKLGVGDLLIIDGMPLLITKINNDMLRCLNQYDCDCTFFAHSCSRKISLSFRNIEELKYMKVFDFPSRVDIIKRKNIKYDCQI